MAIIELQIASNAILDEIDRYIAARGTETTLTHIAHWLNTDEATALDWLIFKIGAFRGMTDSDVRRMITGEE
jgi:hypothetical protein